MNPTTIASIAGGLSVIALLASFVGTWAVVKYRVRAIERGHDMCSSKTAAVLEKIFDRMELNERTNAGEHADMRVAIGKIEATQTTLDVVVEMCTDVLKALDRDTSKYHRRRG